LHRRKQSFNPEPAATVGEQLAAVVFSASRRLRTRDALEISASRKMDEEENELLEAINLFFEDPRTRLEPPGEYGTLYLLRRDALRCFGCNLEAITGDLGSPQEINYQGRRTDFQSVHQPRTDWKSVLRVDHFLPNALMDAIAECGCLKEGVLFPGAMVVLAGIDLLAKFHAGSEKPGGVQKRFIEFVSAYFSNCTADDSRILWHFRNALMHSFGLWGSDNGRPVFFNLRFTGGPIVEVLDSGSTYVVDVHALHREFERGLAIYREALDSQQTVRDNFDKMFGHYGKVTFTGKQLLEPHENFGMYSFSPFHRTELGPRRLD
jgi:hypothetical protein